MITGNVTKIDRIQTAMGTMWNVSVDGERYGYGKNKPNFSEGDNITFDIKLNGKYKNILGNTVEVTKGAPATKASAGSADKNSYWEAKEQRDIGIQQGIQQQSARNAAIAFIVPLATAGVIKLPAKAEDKLAAVASLVDEFTDRYFLATSAAINSEYNPENNNSAPFDLGDDD